jgi:hypothetical protein
VSAGTRGGPAPHPRLPTAETLNASVEANTRCPRCAGPVIAMCEGFDAGGVSFDHEIMVRVTCKSGVCGWAATQWRPWSASKPEEL